jgi:hypothetical protein
MHAIIKLNAVICLAISYLLWKALASPASGFDPVPAAVLLQLHLLLSQVACHSIAGDRWLNLAALSTYNHGRDDVAARM